MASSISNNTPNFTSPELYSIPFNTSQKSSSHQNEQNSWKKQANSVSFVSNLQQNSNVNCISMGNLERIEDLQSVTSFSTSRLNDCQLEKQTCDSAQDKNHRNTHQPSPEQPSTTFKMNNLPPLSPLNQVTPQPLSETVFMPPSAKEMSCQTNFPSPMQSNARLSYELSNISSQLVAMQNQLMVLQIRISSLQDELSAENVIDEAPSLSFPLTVHTTNPTSNENVSNTVSELSEAADLSLKSQVEISECQPRPICHSDPITTTSNFEDELTRLRRASGSSNGKRSPVHPISFETLEPSAIALAVRRSLHRYSIGQRVFAQLVLGLSQGTVSELLSKPKSWARLTEKGRNSYRRMNDWLKNPQAIHELKDNEDNCRFQTHLARVNIQGATAQSAWWDKRRLASKIASNSASISTPIAADNTNNTKNGDDADATHDDDRCSSSLRSLRRSIVLRRRNHDISTETNVRIAKLLMNARLAMTKQMGEAARKSKRTKRASSTAPDTTSDVESSQTRSSSACTQTTDPLATTSQKKDENDLNSEVQEISPEAQTRIANLLLHARIAMAEQEEMKHKFCEGGGKKASQMKPISSFPDVGKSEIINEPTQSVDPLSACKSRKECDSSLNAAMHSTVSTNLPSVTHPPVSGIYSSPIKVDLHSTTFPQVLPQLPSSVSHPPADVVIKPEPFVSDQLKPISAEVPPETPPKFTGLAIPTQEDIKRIGDVDTLETSKKIREILLKYSISQRAFGHRVLGMSQGSVSDLLTRPKAWNMLTIKGREPFIRMRMFLENPKHFLDACFIIDGTPVSPFNLGLTKYLNDSVGSKLEPLAPITPLAKSTDKEIFTISATMNPEADRLSHLDRTSLSVPSTDSLVRSTINITSEAGKKLMKDGVNVFKVINDIKDVLSSTMMTQRSLGQKVLGLSQASVSDLLTKGRTWEGITLKTKESYVRLQLFLDSLKDSTSFNVFTAANESCSTLAGNNVRRACSSSSSCQTPTKRPRLTGPSSSPPKDNERDVKNSISDSSFFRFSETNTHNFSTSDLQMLNTLFDQCPKPSLYDLNELAKQLDCDFINVLTWFQNRREQNEMPFSANESTQEIQLSPTESFTQSPAPANSIQTVHGRRKKNNPSRFIPSKAVEQPASPSSN